MTSSGGKPRDLGYSGSYKCMGGGGGELGDGVQSCLHWPQHIDTFVWFIMINLFG